MKHVRKWIAMAFAVCMIAAMLPAELRAAEPQLRFSDPSTTQGATFGVDVTFYADDIGSVDAILNYDTAALKFISGNGATASGSQIQLTGSGSGSTQLSWSLQFQALQVTTTQIEVASVTASSSDGTSLQVTQGNSTITIGEGDPSLIQDAGQTDAAAGGAQIDVNGAAYTVVDFSDILIPAGFTKAEVTLEGQQCPAAIQESSGMYALNLADSAGEESFFLYDPEDGSFSPFEQILISQGERFIIPLTDEVGSQLPSYLQETTFTVNGKTFPAWQNIDNASFYVLYALNSDGEEAYYQYDSLEDTYQRYTVGDTVQEDDGEPSSMLGKVFDKLRDNIDKFLLGTWLIFLFLFLLVIILAVKLRHRNLELDDLYDEYGIDLEEEPEEIPDKKKAKKEKKAEKKAEKKSKKKKEEPEDDGFESFEDFEDDYEEEDFDDPADDEYDLDEEDFVEEDLDDYREEDIEEEDLDEEDFDEDLEDDYDAFVSGADRSFGKVSRQTPDADEEDIDDLDALLNARVREPEKRPRKKPERRSHAEEDDTFKMDIIDLD